MLNRFPKWKNILIVLVVIFAFIYALPNFYGEDPSVQINPNRSDVLLKQDAVEQIQNVLTQKQLRVKAIEQHPNSLLIRFYDTDTQFAAQGLLKSIIPNDFTAAINLAPSTPKWLQFFGAKPMKLGLDLRGGIHFLLDVDVDSVINKRLEGIVKNIMEDLRKGNIRYLNIELNRNQSISIYFREAKYLQPALNKLSFDFPDLTFKQVPGSMQLIGELTPAYIQNTRQYIIEQTATTLRNRVNELGISEPIVQQQGQRRIAVDLPGVQDSSQAKQILGGTATLEFHMVSSDDLSSSNTNQTGALPPGTRLYNSDEGEPLLLDTQVVLSGNSITSAVSNYGQDGRPTVDITLGGGGEAYFSKVTQDNVGRRMAIVYVETKTIDQINNGIMTKVHKKIERIISAPVIQSALGNQFQITGLSDPLEAKNLALLLRAGAMPANVDIIQERTIGPSLGLENIHMGLLSVTAAFIIIVIFMALYYQAFGIFADLALFVNLVLIIAIMSILGMTLTMPGIAGIVLTVGMAVDGNVLIFERIREEIRNNSTIQTAIHGGFERAFATIVDANLTNLIVALILFSFGTGPVQGFAVTLTVGLLTSMFTAITFTRALVNWCYGGKSLKKIAIGLRWDKLAGKA